MNRILLFFVAVLLLFCGAFFIRMASQSGQQQASVGSQTSEDTNYEAPEKELSDFEFTDQLASTFHSKQLDGKVWLGSFFFADCPTICHEQNVQISKLHQRFRDQGVQVVSITVAPKDDPPHKLLAYGNRYSADHETWKFLTGKDPAYVNQVGIDIFGLPAKDQTHTSEVAVFDQSGNMHGTYTITDAIEYAKCAMKVEELLAGETQQVEVEPAKDQPTVGDQDQPEST